MDLEQTERTHVQTIFFVDYFLVSFWLREYLFFYLATRSLKFFVPFLSSVHVNLIVLFCCGAVMSLPCCHGTFRRRYFDVVFLIVESVVGYIMMVVI